MEGVSKYLAKEKLIFLLAAVLLLVVAPLTLSGFRLNLLGKFLAYAILALGIDLIWGYTGILSLGHGVFFGLGAYCMAMYLKLEAAAGKLPDFMVWSGLNDLPWFWEPFRHAWFALGMAILLPVVLATILGFLTFRNRIQGVYFSILSQALAIVTNDIYTKEDAEFLIRNGVLPAERIIGVETGGCPHTAIREDASMNLEAIDKLLQKFPDLDIIFVESGGDNLAATFSPELVDLFIFVIDVSEGDKIPRKGGPAITRSDLLIINKIDLALHVGASLEIMARDSRKMRGTRPFVFTNLFAEEGLPEVIDWIKKNAFLDDLACQV